MLRPLPPLPTTGWPNALDESVGDENYDLPQKRQSISFQLELFDDYDDGVTYLTPIRQLVTTYRLPICVRVGADQMVSSFDDLTMKEGDLLVLHFIVRRKRVFGTDAEGEEIVLPLHASQLYEILPKDPILDDLVFKSTAELINSTPLPSRVRVVSPDTSLEGENGHNIGDVIDISHVEETDVHGFDRKKTLIGTCNGQRIVLDDHVTSWYTTMVHTEPKTICSIAKVVPLPSRIRKTDDRSVICIKECKEELHVIATHLESGLVVTIPVDSLCILYLVDTSLEQITNSIEPLFPMINWTMCVREMGRPVLPQSQQEIPQPMDEVLDQWLDSEDGKARVKETLQDSYSQCTNRIDVPKIEPEYYAEQTQGGIRKKNSIRDKIKRIRSMRRNSECEDPYANLGAVPEIQVTANLQIQEMKQVLTSKERECVHLKRENETLRMEAQTLQGEITRLQTANKDYVNKIYEMHIQMDNKAEIPNNKDVTPLRATSNEYVGMTNDRNLRNLTSKLEEDSEILETEMNDTGLHSASVDDVIKLLKELKLDSYCDRFKREDVNGALLLELDFDMLYQDLKMSRLHAKKLLIELKRRTEGK